MHGLPAPDQGNEFRASLGSITVLNSFQDRSLGYVELKLSELAQTAEGKMSTFVSTGRKIGEDPIRLDKGSYKGKLFYEAEFVPALRLKEVKFSSGGNAIQRAAETSEDVDGDDVSDSSSSKESDEYAQNVPDGITVSSPTGAEVSRENGPSGHSKSKSTDTTNTMATADSRLSGTTSKSEASMNGLITEEPKEEEGVEMSKEDLLRQREILFPTCDKGCSLMFAIIPQNLVSSFSMFWVDSCTRRRAWKFCSTKRIGRRSARSARAAPTLSGSTSAKDLLRNSTLAVFGSG